MKSHSNKGPIILSNLRMQEQYEEMVFENFTLKRSHPDNYCSLSNGIIVEIVNFVQTDTKQMLIGYEFLEKSDFFTSPCNSSEIDIYLVPGKKSELQSWNITEICFKCVKLHFKDKFVFLPLLHTY